MTNGNTYCRHLVSPQGEPYNHNKTYTPGEAIGKFRCKSECQCPVLKLNIKLGYDPRRWEDCPSFYSTDGEMMRTIENRKEYQRAHPITLVHSNGNGNGNH